VQIIHLIIVVVVVLLVVKVKKRVMVCIVFSSPNYSASPATCLAVIQHRWMY